jgi:hypothetical protein
MKTNYHKKLRVNKNVTPIFFGKADEVEGENGEVDISLEKAIDEYTFYYLYCSINNITSKNKLANTQLVVLSAIMTKPLNFSLPVDSKDGKLTKIAEQLSTPDEPRTANSIYQAVKRLRDAGYLIENEDKLIVPNAILQRVRYIVKREIESKGFATFDYLFKCYITEDGSNNKENN